MKKLVFLGSLIIITISAVFASWFAIHNDIVFHTDIARDFLLMEDVVKVKPFTLIGPRSGGIPGVFHGPLWTYLNIPAFIVGGGSPAVVGWFWVLLFLINVFVIFKIGESIFNREVGYLAAALSSVISAFSVPGYFNPFGAVIFSPIFFYFFLKYVNKKNIKYLLISLFALGLVIQFQMAFGLPILVLAIVYLLYFVIKERKAAHLFALLILLIPLSTFILFDLKHDFLQTRSALNYITGKENTGKIDKSMSDVVRSRIKSIYIDGAGFVTRGNSFYLHLFILLLAVSIYKVFKEDKYKDKRNFYILFFYFYLGYWFITVPYKGMMWGYYYWPFLSLIALIFSSTYMFFSKRWFMVIFLLFIFFNFRWEINNGGFKPAAYFGKDGSSWQFHYGTAEKVFNDAPAEFGYYIFTADQFGYSSRYAMNYAQTKYNDKKAYPYEKKPVTYLFIFKSDNPTISDDWWKENKVMIKKQPSQVFKYSDVFRIEKYELTPEELETPSDQDLIHTLIFR